MGGTQLGSLQRTQGYYQQVMKEMESNEPDTDEAYVYISEEDNTLHVRDVFSNASGTGFHLSATASQHFEKLLEIATPGTFWFHGTIPDEIKEGSKQMGLSAKFAEPAFGFRRPGVSDIDSKVVATYQWVAHDSTTFQELKDIFEKVTKEMEANQLDTDEAFVYVIEDDNALHVRDIFKNSNAVGYHLSATASQHFEKLAKIATPGPFFFHGTVPDELKEGAKKKGLPAQFAVPAFGFERVYES